MNDIPVVVTRWDGWENVVFLPDDFSVYLNNDDVLWFDVLEEDPYNTLEYRCEMQSREWILALEMLEDGDPDDFTEADIERSVKWMGVHGIATADDLDAWIKTTLRELDEAWRKTREEE